MASALQQEAAGSKSEGTTWAGPGAAWHSHLPQGGRGIKNTRGVFTVSQDRSAGAQGRGSLLVHRQSSNFQGRGHERDGTPEPSKDFKIVTVVYSQPDPKQCPSPWQHLI